MPAFFSHRKLLRAAHASAGAFAEPTPKCEPRLFMVEEADDFHWSDSANLRSIDEIDGGASINHIVHYRYGCAYTFFKGGFI